MGCNFIIIRVAPYRTYYSYRLCCIVYLHLKLNELTTGKTKINIHIKATIFVSNAYAFYCQ